MLHLDPHVQSGSSLHQANTKSSLQEIQHHKRRIFICPCVATKENSTGTQEALNYLLNGFLFHVYQPLSQTPNKQRTFLQLDFSGEKLYKHHC